MLAFVVGLLLGLGAAFLVDYLDDSIRNPEDLLKLGNDEPVLAVIPIDPPPDHRPIALTRPDDLAVEAYRTLRTNVQFLGLERQVKVIQVTSAVPGEGKTTTATNLAVVLAQTGASVVLVDADLRKPRIHRVFATDGSLGLTNNLVGESIDMAAFMTDLKARFDYVIVDSAPTLAVSDAVALSRHADGVLLVVQAGRTSLPQVRQALATLDQVGAPVLGLVLNRANPKHSNDSYTYIYGYGYAEPDPGNRPAPVARV